MDERHWWIAGKIQESFHIGGYDSPTLLEDFMCEPETLEMINQFLRPGGPCRLFFYCKNPEANGLLNRELHITGSLTTLKNVDLETITILFFLRTELSTEVDPNHMEKDIYCGELKGNTLENLSNLLSEIYIPLVKAKKDWGQCTPENQQLLLHSLEKTLVSLSESSAASHSSKHVLLKHADNLVGHDFKQHRLAALDQHIIAEYEALVSDWMNTIENILHDTSDERFMDPNAGPLSELDRWKCRLRLLTSITEQLKSKECKAVIGVLITAKSRLLKKWKLVDSGITDAMNETKDKVRYLESLKRHLDQLYSGASPSTIINSALPGLVHVIKQMDSVSRFYARQGFLGLLFTKITNQLVLACKDYIQDACITDDGQDCLWDRIQSELLNSEVLLQIDPQQKHLHTQVEGKLRGQQAKQASKKNNNNESPEDETLFARLKACLSLQVYYRDSVRTLRDSLGASHTLSHFTSVSSLAPSTVPRGRLGALGQSASGKQAARVSICTSPSKKTLSSIGGDEGHGVSVADEETIMSHMDGFCSRIREILDVIHTLTQFNRLVMNTEGLPRPRKEDLVAEVVQEEKKPQEEPSRSISPHPVQDGNLDVIAEDEEELLDGSPAQGLADEAFDVTYSNTGLTASDVQLLKKYYRDDQTGEGPSVTSIVKEHVINMTRTMSESVTTKTMLDVESKDKDHFEEVYKNFQAIASDVERFLAAYLHAIFIRKMKTQEALSLITKFSSLQQRTGVRMVISEKFIEIFNWYEGDLEDIQRLYEKFKDDPPLIRNAPPVAGAISWSRQLLKRIEDPMKIFRENKAVTSLKDFGRIVKLYNRLATVLVTFESLWFTHWKQTVDHARNGLRATLFAKHPETNEIIVNADDKVMELIHEARCMARLGIRIPESAQQIMVQEGRFKAYKDHLNLCLDEFRTVVAQIPPALRDLFQNHIEQALQNFQPGLSTLSWNSMNIDAFLHQLHTGTGKLRSLVERVSDIIAKKVEGTIDKIKAMIFFDYNLAFSRPWPPQEFTEMMNESIKQRSEELYTHIATIESGIRESATIIIGKKGRGNTAQERTGHNGQAMSKQEEQIMKHLLGSYHDMIYEAILLATTRTLVTLAESSGCEGEAIRAASALSEAPSSHKSAADGGTSGVALSSTSSSRVQSAANSERSRPMSILSMLSSMTWTSEKTSDITYLQFEVAVKFAIPNIVLDPPLMPIQHALDQVAKSIMQVPQGVKWCSSTSLGEEFVEMIQEDEVIDEIQAQISTVVEDLQGVIKQHLFHFSMYDFLWKDDMHGAYSEFIAHDPGNAAIHKEVERLLQVERKVMAIPQVLPIGSICLQTGPIKDALHGFAMAWKNQYASVLHEEAKKKLDAAVQYRSKVRQHLELNVANLDQLNATLQLLEELTDMENKIDDIYLPIETMYSKLREYELRLPRHEVQEVDKLREHWQELLELAEDVRQILLKEKRENFEQELDKQVKTFVVEVIQFRNAFDSQGPAVPGIPPSEAVHRLTDFQQRYALYDAKRKTLDSVSKLFGIACKPFPELDKTGEELVLLGMLYGLFQKFIRFDERFRETLWAEAELDVSTREVESYWDECLALPSKLKDWDAYNDMKGSIQQYRDVFPLLHKLASKEIRNRHWLQVMNVTGSSFQLEANVFKLHHLLDIGLIKHRAAIEEICTSASRELELEVKLRMTEEEWTEQVLNFEHYKRRGPMYLDKTFTERLLEQLEDAQALLAQMLTSRYIGPLREEAAGWAEKLKEVSEVLEQWLEVQDLWHYLEAVFSNPDTAKELPQEAKRFTRIDKGWTKMMKRAYDTRNVLQCCYGEEVPKGVVLRHIYQELEICFKSLVGYLDNKRHAFPRFYFVSDTILLAILSKPNELDSVKPHLKSLFSAIYDVHLQKFHPEDSESELHEELVSPEGRRKSMTPDKGRAANVISPGIGAPTPGTKIDKRLTAVHNNDNDSDNSTSSECASNGHHYSMEGDNAPHNLPQYISTMLPSEMITEDAVAMESVAVASMEGEVLHLIDRVSLSGGVEIWLNNLKQSVSKTVRSLLLSIVHDINNGMACDEWAYKYPTQICRMGLLYYWTRECEQGAAELKYDRKALSTTSRKFGNTIGKLPAVLLRGSFRSVDDALLPIHRVRIENMVTYSLFLRDLIDHLATRKVREVTDFEWRRYLRFYVQDIDDKSEPCLYILDERYLYGCEFYGAQPIIGHTLTTDKCYLAMSQALALQKGAIVSGSTAVGKTETIKAFAQSLGRFLMLFQCGSNTDPQGLSKVLQGLAMDGSWGCFDDIQRLPEGGVSVLVDHIQAVFGALKSRQAYCFIGEGQEVPVINTMSVFLTHNPDVKPISSLPPELRAQFRQVSLLRPELSLMLKAKCSSLGFKSPSVLAMRLKLVAELAKDQLPDEEQYNLSVASLTGVLQRAAQRRRVAKEGEKSFDRLDRTERTRSDLQDSRSNSVMSTAASQNLVPHQNTNLLPGASKSSPGCKKSGTPNPLSPAAKIDHSLVGNTLMDIVAPRLSQEHLPVFKQIIRDVFAGLPDPPGVNTAMSAISHYDVESAVEKAASEYGLIPHKAWRDKCMQLYNVAQVHQGIIVAGPPGSGKSSMIQSLVDALCVTPRGISRSSNRTKASDIAESNHKLQKIYPLVVDNLDLIFGYLNQNNDWIDGIFTSAWRKATRNQSTTWLCLDGPLNSSWADTFTSVLDSSKSLSLSNGDQLTLSSNVKLLFETDDLAQSTPAIIARSGIVYVDKNVVGWRPIAKAWLEHRTQQEVHVLQRAFEKTLDPLSQYVINDCKPRVKLSEVGMFKTTLNLLSAMLADNIELGGELHIERLYLFCLMWTYGGLLDEKDRTGFSDLLSTLSTALPDDDRDICFFDYYVDESGEWDPWQSRVPEAAYTEHLDILGHIFVDTVDTIRTRMLVEFACASGQNVMLIGPPGSGKTSMLNDFLDSQDSQHQVTKRLVYSGASTASQLQQFLEANVYHRQGFVYGAKENKRLQLFIDDLNLPKPDEHGVQRCNELLRRLVDDRVLCTMQKPFEWRTIEGLTVLSAMSLSDCPSIADQTLAPRLTRHFAMFSLPTPADESLKKVVYGILEANMLYEDKPALDIDLHNAIVQASCTLLAALKSVLMPSLMPGRTHYLFTLKDIATCFHCLRRLADESRADNKLVVSLWKHEMERIIRDRICRYSDMLWYDETVEEIVKNNWPELVNELHTTFVTFPVDARSYNRPVTSVSKKEVKVVLQPVDNKKEVMTCLQTHLNRYNEEFGNIYLDIMLSDNIINHIIKMHRVISYHHSGNIVLVGPIGSHLSTLIRLALHVSDLPIHPIDSSKQNTFFDGLRSAVRLTGSEGKVLTVFFTARNLEDDQYLDAINSLLVSGEYPHLFTNDEMEGLLQALVPVMKRERTAMDPNKFFVSRVKINLHVIICLPPQHPLLQTALKQYPGLLSGCQVIWMCDWTKDSLLGEAQYYLNRYKLTKDCEADLSESITTCMANIHSYVLQDCNQTKWSGETEDEITMTQVKINEKKNQMKTVQVKMPNRPYSKALLLENIKLKHRHLNIPTISELFVGPTTYKRFMDTFRRLYTQKAEERTLKVNKLKRVIATLDQTRKDASHMKQSIRKIIQQFEEAKENTAGLMQRLTAKATVLEKLKARIGMATALSAFLQLNELSDEEPEEDDLLKEEERDEYDDEFDRMREENLKTRHYQAKEELITAQKTVEECNKKLAHARQQVIHWREKVDRNCIEHLRAFQNPPLLVGLVMEMVMTLIGKRLPSQRLDVRDAYPSKDEHSGRYSASSSSTKFTASVKKSKPRDVFSKQSWKDMQQTMTDSGKFVDMLHNVPWEDGLADDVTAAVESYLAKSKDGELGVTGEGSLLDNAQDKEKGFVAQKGSQSPDTNTGITIKNAKYSSEDAATLVQYTIAIVEFTHLCGPLKAAQERVQELLREIEENDRLQREKEQQPEESDEKGGKVEEPEEKDLTEDQLPVIQAEVDRLQAQFDAAVDEKHSLEMELVSMKERLKAATDMVESLKSQEADWRHHVKEHSNNDMLVANCITAAAFLTYCSGMNTDIRKRMGEFFLTICEHHGLPLTAKKLFKNMELIEFLYKPLEIQSLEKLGLPKTPLMLENASFLMQGDNLMAWPLVCDPTSRVTDWIKDYLKDKDLVTVRYSELKSQFDTCLSDGCPLLVTDIDVAELVKDVRFRTVLHGRTKFVHGRNPFKILVGDHEVECQAHFRMYLHTTTQPHLIPGELAAYVSVIYFHQTRYDVEEELLERFMHREKVRMDEEKTALLEERLQNMEHMSSLETQMIDCLSSDVRLLNDLATTKHMAELKKHYDETQESQSRVATGEVAIERAKESFRIIAKHGAVCFDTTRSLREINPLYQTSFSQFLDLFDSATSHSDRAAVKAVVDRLIQNCFLTTYRFLTERDKHLYSLLLAIEIEDSEGRVGPGEREYLISPSLGSVTMTSIGANQPPDSKFVQAKKPFDWMTDDQFSNLQILAIHYEWFQEMFDRMPKDGRETQWRALCESEQPESQPLPDKMDDPYTQMQRMCVIRAVRSDRLMNMSTLFVHNVLGKKFYGEVSLDLPLVLRQSSPTVPILVLYMDSPHVAHRLIGDFATRKQVTLTTVSLSGAGVSEERMTKMYIQKAAQQGSWILIQNGHTSVHLLSSLETYLTELGQVDPQFRCWITSYASSDLPTHVLQSCIKVMVDTPKSIKDGMVRVFNYIDADTLKQCPRPEWPALLHNLCYLHGAIRLRARYGRGGWNVPESLLQLGLLEAMESIRIATEEFQENVTAISADGSVVPRAASWSGLRFLLAEVTYGTFVADPQDQQSLTAMIEYFISPNAVKRDFEFTKIKYKHPAVFFSNHPRLTQLIQGLDNIPPYQLECPEACNIHPSSETLLGDEQYVFTRLNKVYDTMPSSASLTHQLFPRPPSPLQGPPLANISNQSNNPQVVEQGLFASASFATLRMKKEVELWEVCHNMLSKVPKAYSKDFVSERVKKIGGYTSFNLYIMKELELMYNLLTEIKSTLQSIKNACELDCLGDMLSPSMLEAADDLYYLRIPRLWCKLAGDTMPPPNQALATWLTDLANRCQHFERILLLGREKMPAYWLGAFFNPRGLLAILKQDCYRHHANDRSGAIEQFVFQTEITARDKDHIRDPPAEGMFVFGIYLWGCAWEKTNAELIDQPPRQACAALPVVHLTCWPQGEKPILQDPIRAGEIYSCPVYQSRIVPRESILELDLSHTGVPSQRWALRGLSATVRPY